MAEGNPEQAEAKETADAHGPRIARMNDVAVAVRIEVLVLIETAPQREQCQRRGDKPCVRVGHARTALIVQSHVIIRARLHGLKRCKQGGLFAGGPLDALENEAQLAVSMEASRGRGERDFALERRALREDQLMVGRKHRLRHDRANRCPPRRGRRIEGRDETGLENAGGRGTLVGRRRFAGRRAAELDRRQQLGLVAGAGADGQRMIG